MLKKYRIEELFYDNKKFLEEIVNKRAVIVKGIDNELINILYRESINFFNCPLKEKYCYDDFRGYSLEELENKSIRESVRINDTTFEDDEEKIKQEKCPFYQDFPNLKETIEAIYKEWLKISDYLFKCIGRRFLSVFKYHKNDKAKFKMPEHYDDDYTVAFKPIGEPLDIYIDNSWYSCQLKYSEALLIAPKIKHRVLNKFNKERYSIIFSFRGD